MATIFANNLQRRVAAGKVCKAFGIKLAPSPTVVQIAQQAGFDALFIDLEHSVLSLHDAGNVCTAALLAGLTPFVRVPYQCGDGFVQRVLDCGAMGVIFPHIHDQEDASAAVRISKYPPEGKRSMTGQLPQFSCTTTPIPRVVEQANASGSTVFAMIETRDAIENVDAIAAVKGVDVLLVGSNDLSIELGVPAQFESGTFQSALEKVSKACRDQGKIFGLAGIYGRPDLQDWALNTLGARFILGGQDSAFIAEGAKRCIEALAKLELPK